MTINWEDKETGTVIIDYLVSYNIISDSKKKFKIPIYFITTDVNQNGNGKSDVKELRINGQRIIINNTQKTNNAKEVKYERKEIILSGKTSYPLSFTRRMRFNINYDNYIAFKTKFLLNNLRVNLVLPEDLEAVFIPRGTQHDFLDIHKEPTRVEKKYDGIIFRNQGYIFILNQKRSYLTSE